MELLVLFSPLVPFCTPKRIVFLQFGCILLHFGAFLGVYIFPIAFPPWNEPAVSPEFIESYKHHIIMRCYNIGAMTASIFFSVFGTIETFYLLYVLYRNLKYKRMSMSYRIPKMIQFGILCIFMSFFDWVGLFLYSGLPIGEKEYLVYFTYQVLNIRFLFVVQIFLQLRNITLVKDEMYLSQMPQNELKFLAAKKPDSIHEKATVLRFLDN
jgi:hypothetical protein